MAHLSSTVISATMAWHLVTNDSRFRFSHEFSHILLSQFESWLRDEDINFRFRRCKKMETGWIDSNLFQYLFRPTYDQFDSICVWEFFKDYQMRLITSLSSRQIENLDNDFEENHFFRFDEKYPGYRYACLERLKDSRIPMLYYNDSIPDLELCKVDNLANEEEVDAATQNIRNEYASKMLLLFLPFRDIEEIPLFEDRWEFFLEAYEKGYLYWDAPRLMQNIQDVENSKKIVSVHDELTKTTNGVKMGIDLEEEYGNLDMSDEEEICEHSSDYHHPNEINCDLIMEEFGGNLIWILVT
jgi:hypothetical protein